MDHQVQPSPREHHFYVSIAKFLFYHSNHGIVSVRDPIKILDAEKYSLSPLILYGLTVAGLSIQWMTFTPVDQPKPFREILWDAWRNAQGLRGQPDILRVNRHLATASPGLVEEMALIGVRVEVADGKDKSFPTSLRSAQDSSRWLRRTQDGNDLSLTSSIQTLCQYAQINHDSCFKEGHRGINTHKDEDKIQQWLALPAQMPMPKPALTGKLDWEPGPWLSSWESPLPPNQPRYFHSSEFDGCTWLLKGKPESKDIVEDEVSWADTDYDNMAKIAQNLVACWPNPPAEIAKCVGITSRKLQWFFSGKTLLDQPARFGLETILGIKYDHSMGNYVEVGPYVLVARKPRALKEVYNGMSSGGNACAYEIVPDQGIADPSWRYVLIDIFWGPLSLVMAPRGAKITEDLPELLMNYDGIKPVTPDFYRDVVSTCAQASNEPATNIRTMKDFVKRYELYWRDCV